MRALSMDLAAVSRAGAVASASVCALVVGLVVVQYKFTLKRKIRLKSKILEMIQCKDNILSVTSLKIFVVVLAFFIGFYLRL